MDVMSCAVVDDKARLQGGCDARVTLCEGQ